MVTFLLAVAPLVAALLEIGLIQRLMGRRRRPPLLMLAADPARSADTLASVFGSLGLATEAIGADDDARIELICRDPRPVVGGRWVVHALPDDDVSAASADVLTLAESVWRARGVKGVLVANDFTVHARTAVRTATQVVELIAWRDLVPAPPAVGSAEIALMAGPRAP